MKAKSILLAELVAVAGLMFVSLPAGAECWMTCPPGSTATPSSRGEQGATATVEPTTSPEEATPPKKPEATAKASPTPAPAKPKAAPAPAGATIEPAASPEEATPAKKPEATAKASPTAASTKPTVPPTVQSTNAQATPLPPRAKAYSPVKEAGCRGTLLMISPGCRRMQGEERAKNASRIRIATGTFRGSRTARSRRHPAESRHTYRARSDLCP